MELRGWIYLATTVALGACSSGPTSGLTASSGLTGFTAGETGQSGDDDATATLGDDDGSSMGGPKLDSATMAPPVCGDGRLTSEEACDDGNTDDGDGCSADCLVVTPGYICAPPGTPCREVVRCGDGLVSGPELCDDGNTTNLDGCDDLCKVEIGFKCEGDTMSVCTETVCGDGLREGTESCDDGNLNALDGCDERCQTEPGCPVVGACSSTCGDGLLLGESEQCDDGNSVSGDGCSDTCQVEPGFNCEQDYESCEEINGECILRVNIIYRDFTDAHPDFEPPETYACLTDGEPSTEDPVTGERTFDAADKVTFNMVEPTLDDDAKPVAAAANCATPATFAQWYRDDPAVNTTYHDTLVLFPNGEEGYVNRFGELGEQWIAYTDYLWAADTLEACEEQGLDCVPCEWDADVGCTADELVFDGTPLFFPLDEHPSTEARVAARIPEQYGYNGWPLESEVLGNDVEHNFYFTSETIYWFVYDPAAAATLQFTGDDDVWVFINGRLAVDLGGIHVPIDGEVVINEATATELGLAAGEAYRVNVFQAERKIDGSSFRLTLSGFETSRSYCRPICGDNIVSLGEECDDGINDGGYGECAEGCVLGEFCGDGVIQPEYEDCDDGNFIDDDACPASCRIIIAG